MLDRRLLLDHFERMDDDECRRILQWVSSVPFGKHHDLVNETRTSGTCEWLLDHKKFTEWECSSSSVILWLQGIRRSSFLSLIYLKNVLS